MLYSFFPFALIMSVFGGEEYSSSSLSSHKPRNGLTNVEQIQPKIDIPQKRDLNLILDVGKELKTNKQTNKQKEHRKDSGGKVAKENFSVTISVSLSHKLKLFFLP